MRIIPKLFLVISAALLAKYFWRLVQIEGRQIDLWTIVVVTLGGLIIAAVVQAFRPSRYERSITVAVVVLAIGLTLFNVFLALSGRSFMNAAQLAFGGQPSFPMVSVGSQVQPASTPGAEIAPPKATPTTEARLEYRSAGTVTALMSAVPSQVSGTDGASFLGYSFSVEKPQSVLHVRVVANAYANDSNEVVLAIFQSGVASPIKLVSKTIKPNSWIEFDEAFDIPADGQASVTLDVRMGVTRPGTVFINGPSGQLAQNIPVPFIEIREGL